MKTSELSGAALDWAVAKARGLRVEYDYQYTEETFFQGGWQCGPDCWQPLPKYSSDWAHGGPIIERELIRLDTAYNYTDGKWKARIDSVGGWWPGETPLIAAMRCYCCAKLGDEVDVPEELK